MLTIDIRDLISSWSWLSNSNLIISRLNISNENDENSYFINYIPEDSFFPDLSKISYSNIENIYKSSILFNIDLPKEFFDYCIKNKCVLNIISEKFPKDFSTKYIPLIRDTPSLEFIIDIFNYNGTEITEENYYNDIYILFYLITSDIKTCLKIPIKISFDTFYVDLCPYSIDYFSIQIDKLYKNECYNLYINKFLSKINGNIKISNSKSEIQFKITELNHDYIKNKFDILIRKIKEISKLKINSYNYYKWYGYYFK